MEKKIKTIILIAIIVGAGVSVGVTTGIIISQQGGIDQTLLFLTIISPKKTIDHAPTSNHPDNITTAAGGVETINWTLHDDVGPGQYGVWANDSNDNYYLWVDWTNWTNNENLEVPINRTIGGVFNYTIVFNDSNGQFGTPDTVIVTILNNLPTSNQPDNITTSAGGLETINWILYDDLGPGQYRVWANDSNDNYYVWEDWTPWINNTNLAISINRTISGVFNYTIVFNDNNGQFGTPDTVIVNISNDLPTSNHPQNITTAGNGLETINWILYDDFGAGQYRVWANDSNDNYYVWKNWTSWTNNTNLALPINRTIGGVFNYTIVFNDSNGRFGIPDTVIVTILSNLPTSNHPDNVTTATGGLETINWTLYDDLGPGQYRVWANDINDNYYVWVDWTSWTNNTNLVIQINRTGINLGEVYNYTIEFYDNNDQFGSPDTVMVTIQRMWRWVSGNNTIDQAGTYGTKGVPAAGNVPGAREASVSWMGSDDDLWLFGGYGYDSVSNFGRLNDLWMFNKTSGWWTWVSGNETRNQNGMYGTKGVPAAGNIPGARYYSVSWTDSDDNLWLFGGQGYDSVSNFGWLNDLWMFNMTSGWWTWVSGSNITDQLGTYGTKGMPATGNIPGARSYSASWTDSDDNLWLFGGEGYDTVTWGYLNDLWMFNSTSGWWTWVSGSNITDQAGAYGTKGVPTAGNVPGARQDDVFWTDSDDNLWLFGGWGYDSAGSSGYLNDLWMFNMTSGWWTWVSGSNVTNQNGIYGTKGVPAAGNIPGARYSSISWADSDDNLWLFGGWGYDSAGSSGLLNDLWIFNMTSGWWTWVSGSNITDQAGTYGTKGVPATGNIPGARSYSVSWTDSDNNLWLFGGWGYDSAGSQARLNDLWKYGSINNAPISNHPADITTAADGSETINWTLYDDLGPGQYRIWTNDSNNNYYIWVNWTPWINNTNLAVPINRTISGIFNYTIVFNDSYGRFGRSDTVIVTILSYPPTSNHPDNITTAAGGVETINWTLYDDVGPGQYRVWANDSNNNYYIWVDWTPWINNTNLIVPINRTIRGVFNYTIVFNDNNGQFGTPDNVMVTVQRTWMWVSGSNITTQIGIYGTKGVPAAGNVPGSRYESVSWTDSDDNLWLFGGYGYDGVSNFGRLNDLWMFNKTSGWWTWMSGTNITDQVGTYGTKGVPAAGNVPGGRDSSISWTDSDDNLWFFGGYGYGEGSFGHLNDLWMFNMTSGWWTWISGSNISNQIPTYGTKGVPAAGNVPGGRADTCSWIDSDNNLWLFGGWGYNSTGDWSILGDLWMFNMAIRWWIWVSGSNISDQAGIYGTKGMPAAGNIPGARRQSVSWTDSDDNLWLFGGYAYDATGDYFLINDLWMFNMTSGWWTWMSGSNITSQKGIYGTKGVPAAGNIPGARHLSVSWTDSDDNLWLFGGYGWDAALGGYLNDLWMFNIENGCWTWMSGSNIADQAGNYGTKGVPAAGNVPGARQDSVSWIDSDDNLWLFGGEGYDSTGTYGRLNDLWKYG